MKSKEINAIERHQMLHPGDTVLVALSGGADSMALLHVLYDIKEEYGISLCAAHFNHRIRGAEADRDEAFAVNVCRELGVEIFVGSADIPAISKQSGMGLEECGRKERYAFFERIAPGAKVATAHTLSDCEETFLFNLARGSSLRGLCSVPPVRDNIIRPLIDCSRADVESYCAENKISFVTDSTNLSDEYTRNSIRHRIVPELKKINNSFDCAFSRCVESLREDEELLGLMASQLLEEAQTENGWQTETLRRAHVSVRRRAVARIIETLTGKKPERQHICAVEALLDNGGSTQVITGVSLCVHCGVLRGAAESVDSWQQEMSLGVNNLPYETLEVQLFDKNNKINTQNFNKELLANVIDYDKIKGALLFGSVAPGDKIRPVGRGVTKQLRKIFNEMHIDPALRNKICILRDSQGVVWVSGIGADERVCPDEGTKRFMYISKVEEKENG